MYVCLFLLYYLFMFLSFILLIIYLHHLRERHSTKKVIAPDYNKK